MNASYYSVRRTYRHRLSSHSAFFSARHISSVVMAAQWKLLEPIAAADRMLMFGVSTVMIFAVVQRLIQMRYGLSNRQSQSAPSSSFKP
jgi:hypothetical protein